MQPTDCLTHSALFVRGNSLYLFKDKADKNSLFFTLVNFLADLKLAHTTLAEVNQ